jgi:hypothetical protein
VSTLVILVVVGLSIVAVTVAVVAEPNKPATKGRRNLRGGAPEPVPVGAGVGAGVAAEASVEAGPVEAGPDAPPTAPAARPARGTLYRPPRWWQRLRSIILLVILATLVGATLAAIVGAILALVGLGVREAVS